MHRSTPRIARRYADIHNLIFGAPVRSPWRGELLLHGDRVPDQDHDRFQSIYMENVMKHYQSLCMITLTGAGLLAAGTAFAQTPAPDSAATQPAAAQTPSATQQPTAEEHMKQMAEHMKQMGARMEKMGKEMQQKGMQMDKSCCSKSKTPDAGTTTSTSSGMSMGMGMGMGMSKKKMGDKGMAKKDAADSVQKDMGAMGMDMDKMDKDMDQMEMGKMNSGSKEM